MKRKRHNLLQVTDRFHRSGREEFFEHVRQEIDAYKRIDLSIASNLSPTTITNFRTGKTENPSTRTLLRLMFALGLRPSVVRARFKLKLFKVA